MEYFFKDLGMKIKRHREAKGITIKEIAKKTGIRKEYLIKIEDGKATRMISHHLYRIADALNIEPHILIK